MSLTVRSKQRRLLSVTRVVCKVDSFPPKPAVLLIGTSDADWAVRLAIMRSISVYARALSEGNDPALSKSIAETSSSLSVALANFETARLTGDTRLKPTQVAARSQQIQGVGAIVGDLLGFASELYTGVRIREVMAKTHPVLEEAVGFLKKDLAELTSWIELEKGEYEAALQDKLRMYADDGSLNTISLYDLYTAAAIESAGLDARIEVLRGANKALDGMVSAHYALIESVDDKRAIAAFVEVVEALADKVKKLRDLDKTARVG